MNILSKKNWYTDTLEFEHKKFAITKSAKFKGNLNWIYDDNGIIYDIRFEFDYAEIDLYTTAKWFEKQNHAGFQRREQLFKFLGDKFIQHPRPSKKSHKLIVLNKNEILKLNTWLKDHYNSTITNVVQLLKGNNPTGTDKNPKSAEIILKYKDKNIKFATFFEYLIVSKKEKSLSLKEKNFIYDDFKNQQNYFENIPDELKIKFDHYQNTLNQKEKENFQHQMQQYFKNYSKYIEYINNEVVKYRNEYQKKIKEKYILNFQIFNFNEDYIEKCHIVPVWYYKQKLIELKSQIKRNLASQKQFNEILKNISNTNNYLNLPGSLHNFFDKNWFTYDEKGNFNLLNDPNNTITQMFIEKHTDIEKIKKINPTFLNHERVSYLKIRNNIIMSEKTNIN